MASNLQKDLEKANPAPYAENFEMGLNEEVIRKISQQKKEPDWVLKTRLKALDIFQSCPLPKWGPDLSNLDFDRIRFYASAGDQTNAKTWEEVDPKIKNTFERLKIPEAEREYLAGVGAQYESENVYHNLKPQWEKQGIIFEDIDQAIINHPKLVQKYFATCVPLTDHKFAALHYAVFSGGTFLYVPKGVKVDAPLQAYFRMNAINQGQFEHTCIVLEEGAQAHYIEGCSAPKYGSQSLHAGCVEVFVGEGAKFRYSSVENWSKDTYNLNTKRAIVKKDAQMKWVGGNLGSGVTMLYPCSLLVGDNASTDHLGVAMAAEGQNQDTGAKVVVGGKNNRVQIKSKSISKDGGIATYRGLVEVQPNASESLVQVECDGLMLDDQSVSKAIPEIKNQNPTTQVIHEAKVGKISEEILFYAQTRGLSEEEAKGLIVNGFLDEVVATLPLEFAGEMNRLIEMEMEEASPEADHRRGSSKCLPSAIDSPSPIRTDAIHSVSPSSTTQSISSRKGTWPCDPTKITIPANTHHILHITDHEPGSRTLHLEINLEGENATCEVIGRVSTKSQDQKSWTIIQKTQNHAQKGHINLHGVAEDESQITFDGKVLVDSSSTQADVHVAEKIWLFDQAQGTCLPVLEVETDEVESVDHAAAVTPIDPALIFYLETRGIEEKEAREMLKNGFLKE